VVHAHAITVSAPTTAIDAVTEAAAVPLRNRALEMDSALEAPRQATTLLVHDNISCRSVGHVPLQEPRVLVLHRDLCVLWKPAGWTVLASEATNAPAIEDWTARRFGDEIPIARDAGASYGLLHRLDRQTSGLLLCARSYMGYHLAHLQFASRRTRKEYVLFCHDWLAPEPRSFEAPLLQVSINSRIKRSIESPRGRFARTELLVAYPLLGPAGERLSLVEVRLHSGRMHQIRAHMSGAGHPLLADVDYGGTRLAWCPRIALHSKRLKLDIGGIRPVAACSGLPEDLMHALQQTVNVSGTLRALTAMWLNT